ncbi:hypothetical protein T07_10535, partial [Trichinella nelsoni]
FPRSKSPQDFYKSSRGGKVPKIFIKVPEVEKSPRFL